MSYVLFAMGGLKVDKFQRVWDIDKQPSLYAIGNEGNNHYASVYTSTFRVPFGHQVNSGRVAAQQRPNINS